MIAKPKTPDAEATFYARETRWLGSVDELVLDVDFASLAKISRVLPFGVSTLVRRKKRCCLADPATTSSRATGKREYLENKVFKSAPMIFHFMEIVRPAALYKSRM